MNNRKRIFILEDDIDLVEAMKITLVTNNFEVDYAYDPENGIQKIKDFNPDLLILDVMFGIGEKSKGFDFAIKIRQDENLASVPIIIVSAINAEHPGFGFSKMNSSEYMPVDDFIDKPAQPDDLIRKVESLLKQGTSKWVNWPEKSN